MLQAVGLIDEPILFFAEPANALLATVFLIVWKFVGLYMLILLVGLQPIPTDVYEAAAIDGASRWQTLRRITLPLLRPSLALALIVCVTGSLLAFDQFYLLTKGGPDNSTVTIVQLIYQQAFVRQNLGVAAALSMVVLVALLALNLIWFRLLRRGTRRRDDPVRSTVAWSRTPYYVLTGGLAVVFLFPLLWSAIASVSPQPGTAQTVGYGLGNYQTLFEFQAGLPTFLLNSVIVSGLTVAVTLIVSSLGGYAFARFDFPGKNVLFLVTLAILMVPYATLLIPLYVLLRDIGLGNSLLGLSLVLAMYQLPFATFMMRISFEAIPREVEESALLRRCRDLRHAASDHAAERRSGPHHRRPVRVPRRLE